MDDATTEKKHSSLINYYQEKIRTLNEKLHKTKFHVKYLREQHKNIKSQHKKESVEKNIAKYNSLLMNITSQMEILISEKDTYITSIYPTFFHRSRSLMFGELSKHREIDVFSSSIKSKKSKITVKSLKSASDIGDLLVDKHILKKEDKKIINMIDQQRYFKAITSASSITKCRSCDFGELVEGDGYYYCPRCFSTFFDILESSSTISSEENTKKEKRNNDYKKVKRFMIWLNDIQGKIKMVDELEALMERINKKIEDDGIDEGNITTTYLLSIFKQMKTFEYKHKMYKFNAYYSYIPYVYSRIRKIVLPTISEQEVSLLRKLFSEFIYWFHVVEDKNSVIYSHLVSFLLNAVGRDDISIFVGQISDEEKLLQHQRTSELILKKAREHKLKQQEFAKRKKII